MGFGPARFYKLKAKGGGMDLSDTKRLKQLEEENAKLKRLVADLMLDKVVLKDLQGRQCLSRCDRCCLQLPAVTGCPIKHPDRNLQTSISPDPGQAAAKPFQASPLNSL